MSLFGTYIKEDPDIEIDLESVIILPPQDEVVTEDTIYTDAKNNYAIIVTPDLNRAEGYFGDPYFKLINSFSYDKATECVRIYIFNNLYTYHKGELRELYWNSKVAKYLNTVVKLHSIKNEPSSPTVWSLILNSILRYYYSNVKRDDIYMEKLLSAAIPDFKTYRRKIV